jgi:hypothetical protein
VKKKFGKIAGLSEQVKNDLLKGGVDGFSYFH